MMKLFAFLLCIISSVFENVAGHSVEGAVFLAASFIILSTVK